MNGYHVQRVYLDCDLYEDGRGGWLYTVDGVEMRYREFLAFLREIGVRPKDIPWEYAGGFNIAGAEWADIFSGEDGEDEE